MKDNRLIEIDVAKGLAIALVVIGHIPIEIPPQGNDWYLWLHRAIYKFHMPFFMFLSGFIMYYTYKPLSSAQEYLGYVKKKSKRLLPGFIIFAILIYLGKLYLSPYLYVDNAPNGINEFINILIKPMASPARSLWYIYVLLEFYLFFPLLFMLARNNLLVVLASTFALRFVPATSYFSIDLLFEYAFFFSIGIVACQFYPEFKSRILKRRFIFIFLFLLSFSSIAFLDANSSKLLISLFSIPAIYAIVSFDIIKHSSILYMFGKYTYPIYLLNTITIGLTKGVVLQFIAWDGIWFLLIAPLLWCVGLWGSIYIKRHVFVRVRALDVVTS